MMRHCGSQNNYSKLLVYIVDIKKIYKVYNIIKLEDIEQKFYYLLGQQFDVELILPHRLVMTLKQSLCTWDNRHEPRKMYLQFNNYHISLSNKILKSENAVSLFSMLYSLNSYYVFPIFQGSIWIVNGVKYKNNGIVTIHVLIIILSCLFMK